jgi:beta-phosphoglucomutase
MKQGIILDLDGVICDTAEFHYKAWKRLAAEYDFLLTHEHNEQLKGVSRADSLQLILEWAGRVLNPDQFNRDLDRKNGWYLELVETMNSKDLLPGVREFFERAVRYNIPLALGSASKNARLVLSKVGLIDAFKGIVDASTVTNGKPHPETFLKAAELLNIAPENCIVFEDSLSGIQAAKAANMYTVGVGIPQDLPLADEYVSNLGNYDFQTYLN